MNSKLCVFLILGLLMGSIACSRYNDRRYPKDYHRGRNYDSDDCSDTDRYRGYYKPKYSNYHPRYYSDDSCDDDDYKRKSISDDSTDCEEELLVLEVEKAKEQVECAPVAKEDVAPAPEEKCETEAEKVVVAVPVPEVVKKVVAAPANDVASAPEEKCETEAQKVVVAIPAPEVVEKAVAAPANDVAASEVTKKVVTSSASKKIVDVSASEVVKKVVAAPANDVAPTPKIVAAAPKEEACECEEVKKQ